MSISVARSSRATGHLQLSSTHVLCEEFFSGGRNVPSNQLIFGFDQLERGSYFLLPCTL